MKLLDANRNEDGPLDRDDLLLLGQLTLARSETPSKQAALTEFDRASDVRKLGFEESLLRAQLQNGVDDWQGCNKTMTELLAAELQKNRSSKEKSKFLDLRILDPYLRMLLERDDLAEASRWLESCPPDSGTAIRTRVHLLVRRGRTSQAIDIFKQLVSGNNEQQLLFVAGLAEELGVYDPTMYAAAESAWKRLVAVRPAMQLRYVEFLLRRPERKRAAEVMQLVEKLHAAGRPLAAIQQGITLLRSFPEDLPRQDDYVRTIRDWLSEAKKTQPDNSSLVIQESELEAVLGNEARQESLLRDYLAAHPEKDIPKAIVSNNLAYIEAVKGNGAEAKRFVQGAIEILGPLASLRDTIGMTHFASEEWEAAIDNFQTAIDQGQQSAISRYHLAAALWKSGEQQRAADEMAKAVGAGLKDSDFSPSELRQFQAFVTELKSAGFSMPAEKTTANPGAATDQQI